MHAIVSNCYKFEDLLGSLQLYKYLTSGNIQIRKQITHISELSHFSVNLGSQPCWLVRIPEEFYKFAKCPVPI